MNAKLEVKGAAGWITLDRPTAMNALNGELVKAVTTALDTWQGEPQVRVVVLTGSGSAFCAGADLKEAAAPSRPGERDLLDQLVSFFDTLRAFRKPVIAAVN